MTASEFDDVVSVQESFPSRSALEGSARRLRGAGRGRRHQGSVGQADQVEDRQSGRLRQAHRDAGSDRLSRAHPSQRGLHQPHGGGAAHPDDGALGRPPEAHARSRLHDGARRRRRRLGHQDCGRIGPDPRPAHVHLLPLHWTNRRPQRPQSAHRHRAAVPVLQRHGVHPLHRRRPGRGAQGHARADAPGRGPGEADGLGRRRLTLRSAGVRSSFRSRRSPPPSRRHMPSDATFSPTPIRPRPSRAPSIAACAPSSTAISSMRPPPD